MFDLQHDSPVPLHEQIESQMLAHVGSGALKAGARLKEIRAFAQELVTNPQVVARSYGDLEWAGVIKKDGQGGWLVTPGAAVICKARLQVLARTGLRQAVAKARSYGLLDADIRLAFDEEIAAKPAPTATPDEARQGIKQPKHETSNRDSQAIQVLPG